MIVTVSPESTVAQHSGVPWWIILVAVLAGVLILALLVYLLWKVSSVSRGHDCKYGMCFDSASFKTTEDVNVIMFELHFSQL